MASAYQSARANKSRRPQAANKPAHSITSSASASSVAGTSRPSVLAVLRLIVNPIFVACMMEPMSADEIAELYAADAEKYAKIIREAGIKLSE